jgi:hypothetical protein
VVREPRFKQLFYVSRRKHKVSCDSNSAWNIFETIPPRRCQDTPMPDPAVEREMRELCARLDAMVTVHI